DAAEHRLHLVLEDELAVALDGVLRVRLFLDDELHGASKDSARLVHALEPPLGGAQPRGAHGGRDTGADREHADLHGAAGLREHRRRVAPHRCRGGPGAHESEQASPSRPHGVLLEGARIVLDGGTGGRGAGLPLVRTMPQPMRLHLFIGHTHWDHIQGIPFFIPAFLPGAELNIYAPRGFQRSLEEAMSGQMEYSYFPVKLRELRSRIHYTELDEGLFRVGEVRVETQYLNHTGPTIGYRLSSGGATVAHLTDHEPFWSLPGRVSQHPGDERHIAFMRGADLVIHDAQYTEEEYRGKVGWGHRSLEYAVDVALAAGVARLVLFHHDPQHDDPAMERIESHARVRATAHGSGLDVLAAREGLELEVRGNGATRDVAAASALQHREIAGGRVLVVSGNDTEGAGIEEVL